MNTTAGSCNTKMYFVSRFLLQGLYIYLSLTLVANKTLKWEALNEDVNRNEVQELQIICAVVAIFSCIIYGALIWNSHKLIKVKKNTEFDRIRGADMTQMYEPVNSKV